MRIAISGSSGLVGTALVASLRADGHDVVRLVRRPARDAGEVAWEPSAGVGPDPARLAGLDAAVHLSGAGVGDHRWTARYRDEIVRSRVDSTAVLVEALAAARPRPGVLLSASAVGYYGDTGDRTVDESAPPGAGFLADTCVRWEAAADPARAAGIRTVHLRSGIVLAAKGGALGKVLPLFRLGLGARLGSGRQYVSWISLPDHIAAIRFLLDGGGVALAGPVNLTAPHPVTNAEYTAAIARAVRRPAPWRAPGFAVRLLIGGFATEVLGGQRVLPSRLSDAGFAFAHPRIDAALADVLAR